MHGHSKTNGELITNIIYTVVHNVRWFLRATVNNIGGLPTIINSW